MTNPHPLDLTIIQAFRDKVAQLKNSKAAKTDIDEYGSCETEVTEFGYRYFDGEKRDWWTVVDFGHIEKYLLTALTQVRADERSRIAGEVEKMKKEQLDNTDPDNYGACYAIAGFNNALTDILALIQPK